MKLLHYNVYCGQGCKTGATEEKLAKLGAWLKAQAADVVGLTECNEWDSLPLARIAQDWGYPHTELLVTTSGYHVALLAKLPIQRFGTYTPSPRHPLAHPTSNRRFGRGRCHIAPGRRRLC